MPVRLRADVSEALAQNWRLILCVFLPFVAAYYLSFLFRTINATVAGALTSEFGLGAGDLGLLTSVYYLTFAAAQIPIGILLDRYGPGRIQSAVMVAAALGAAIICCLGQFLAAARRPSADRSWCRRIIDGWLESPRALVSQGTCTTAQRSDDHVGGVGCADGNLACGIPAGLGGLASIV